MPDAVAEAGIDLFERHGAGAGRRGEFELLGHAWTLLPGVFAPVHAVSTELFATWLPFPDGGHFLEINSGTGVTAVIAALRGCARVTAVDSSAAAVANTSANAARHGVADRARVFRSDVFDAFDGSERFDVIYWNSNVIDAPEEFEHLEELRWAFFDRGYAAHTRYLRQGPRFLAPNGRMFLGFTSLGNVERLRAAAAEAGLDVVTVNRRQGALGDIPVELSLLELIPG
jgi:methylase of polypeptide subunit release factors